MSTRPQPSKLNQDPADRYYGFDHLKTVMMIGVVVLHAALTYMVIAPGKIWPIKDVHATNLLFDITAAYLSCITMPIFFVMSGFFTSLILKKRGIPSMLKDRLKRVFYPLLTGIVTIIPLSSWAFYYFESTVAGHSSPMDHSFSRIYTEGFGLLHFKFWHFWFLYCLMIFCLVGGGIGHYAKRSLPKTVQATSQMFSFVYRLRLAPILFAIPTFILLSLRHRSIIETPNTFNTNILVLLSHAAFFYFGWLLFHVKDIALTKRRGIIYTLSGILFFIAKLIVFDRWGEAGINEYILAGINSIFIWLLIFGHIGIFLKYFNKPSRVIRYLSDASYWIYLVHLPIVVVSQALLITLPVNALIKFGVVMLATFVVAVTSYNYLVRDTVIGSFLNGKRYRRGLPER